MHPSYQVRPAGPRARPRSPKRPPPEEKLLRSEFIQIERKTFVFNLRENSRGRFLRIIEDVGGKRDSIIIPAPGLDEFVRRLEATLQFLVRAEPPLPVEAPATATVN